MKKKILVADDSITIQKVIEMAFMGGDYEVFCAGNGREALSKFNQYLPDIVLADTIMPEMDGYTLCSTIKSMADFSHVPVLLLSGAFEPFDRDRAEMSGADGILTKPFESRFLIEKVEKILNPVMEEPAIPELEASAHEEVGQSEARIHPSESEIEDFPVDLDTALEISDSTAAISPHFKTQKAPVHVEQKGEERFQTRRSGAGSENEREPEYAEQPFLRLSEEEIESIARKVFQMLSEDFVKKVIKETISETAERIIRERIKELEEHASE
ncbi:MAG: response regulator [Acidobacteriota bacterium]